MPTVTLTLTDTPDGEVDIHCAFDQTPCAPVSMAQSATLEIMARTRANWSIAVKPSMPGVDIDAVHRSRGNAVKA